jgi:hypothetical protein
LSLANIQEGYMLQYHEIEQLAFEQHAAYLDAAERQRLLQLALDAADNRAWGAPGRVSWRRWLGGRLVQWGERLQGKDAPATPDLAVGRPCTSMSMR